MHRSPRENSAEWPSSVKMGDELEMGTAAVHGGGEAKGPHAPRGAPNRDGPCGSSFGSISGVNDGTSKQVTRRCFGVVVRRRDTY